MTTECKLTEDCFTGTNRSSTFIGPAKNASARQITFGSSTVIIFASTDIVRVGDTQATMTDSLQLMVNRKLRMPGDFEGILGLGIPSWVQSAKVSPKIAGSDPANQKIQREMYRNKKEEIEELSKKHDRNYTELMMPTPRFHEEAGIKRFSICMDDNGDSGVLRVEPPEAPKMLKQIGHHHWSLGLQGISAGSATAPITICSKDSKPDEQDVACAAVPDSGTTQIMGPSESIRQLYAEVCNRWPRCKDHENPTGAAPEEVFLMLIHHCADWMGKDLSEVPSIFLHFAAANGDTQVLELTSWAYIIERTGFWGRATCAPLFGVWEQTTAFHGPMWIFGTPLFYEYQVVFGLHPPSIGFSNASCGSCDTAQVKQTENFLIRDRRFDPARRVPRVMNVPPRMPSFGTSDPL